MSYATIEARIQSILQGLSDYADTDVTRGDLAALDRGSDNKCIIWPRGFEAPDLPDNYVPHGGGTRGGQTAWIEWQLELWLLRRFKDWATSMAALVGVRDNVIQGLLARPTLEALTDITKVRLVVGDDWEGFPEASRAPEFILMPMTLTVTEKTSVTYVAL